MASFKVSAAYCVTGVGCVPSVSCPVCTVCQVCAMCLVHCVSVICARWRLWICATQQCHPFWKMRYVHYGPLNREYMYIAFTIDQQALMASNGVSAIRSTDLPSNIGKYKIPGKLAGLDSCMTAACSDVTTDCTLGKC